MNKKEKRLLVILLVAAMIIAAVPLFILKDAEFGGSDDAGSVMIEEISGQHDTWFAPVAESLLGREIPGEIESLLFCVQTGIGTGIAAFFLGRMYERKKLGKSEKDL